MYRYLHQLLEAQNWLREPGIIVKTRTSILASKRRSMIVEKGQKCAYCGSMCDLTLDHKLARALGGDNNRGNLQVLCKSCNKAKAVEENELLAMLMTDEGRAELLRQWAELQAQGQAKGKAKVAQRQAQRAQVINIIEANCAAGKYDETPSLS